MRRVAMALCALLCVASVGHAQTYQWVDVPGCPRERALLQDGYQIGNWFMDGQCYKPLLPGPMGMRPWGAPCPPPVALPAELRNFGVQTDQLAPERERRKPRYRINGKEVPAERAKEAIKKGSVPDDAKKQKLSFFLSADKLQDALADLPKALGDYAGKVAVQLYPEDSWVTRYGFAPNSTYVQNPNGDVVSRTEGLPPPSKIQEALTKAEKMYNPDPGYDKTKDPDLTQEGLPGGPLTPADWAAGGGSLLVILGALARTVLSRKA